MNISMAQQECFGVSGGQRVSLTKMYLFAWIVMPFYEVQVYKIFTVGRFLKGRWANHK